MDDDHFVFTDIRAEQAQELVDTLRVRLGGSLFNEQQLPLATLEVLAGILEELHMIEGHLRAARENDGQYDQQSR